MPLSDNLRSLKVKNQGHDVNISLTVRAICAHNSRIKNTKFKFCEMFLIVWVLKRSKVKGKDYKAK